MKSQATFVLIALLTLQSGNAYARKMAQPAPQLSDELVSFGSCRELESHVDKLFSVSRVDSWEGAGYGGKKNSDFSRAKRSDMPASAPMLSAEKSRQETKDMASGVSLGASLANEPQQVTGTNNQVEKVDEADFVKFDGKHILQLHNGALKILKAWPASEMNQIASLAVSGQPQEMLVSESNVVAIVNVGQSLKAIVIDISKPNQPRIATEFEIPGQYRTARLIGNTLRIINQDYGSFADTWTRRPVPESNGWIQEETVTRKLVIKPTTQSVNGNLRTLDMVKDCKNIYVPKDVAPSVLTRIVSIDLKAKKYDETMAFVQPQTVYASESAIYLAQSGYGQDSGRSLQQTTIHKFLLPEGETAKYQASGIVNGHLIKRIGHLKPISVL